MGNLREKMWHRIGEKRDNVSIASSTPNALSPFTRIALNIARSYYTVNMQPGERSPPMKATGETLTPCPCNACFQRKDLNNEAMLPHHREFYNQNRLVGFGPQMSMLPFAPIPSSPAALYASHSLQRASYPREMFAPTAESRYSLAHGVQDMPKRSTLHEGHLVQSQALQRSPDAPGRYWQQQPSRK